MTPIDYEARRKRFLEQLPQGAVAVLPAATPKTRTADVEYPFRQDNDFLYLTGFPEPGSVAVLDPGSDNPFQLFVQPRDPDKETWTGFRHGPEGAKESFGADAAHPIADFRKFLTDLLPKRPALAYPLGVDPEMDAWVLPLLRQVQQVRTRTSDGVDLLSPKTPLANMRLRKEPAEIERMRRAAAITKTAHEDARELAQPGRLEYEIEAAIAYAFRRQGAAGPAYDSIVASGANATTLHYVSNDRKLEAGDFLLIDAGAEYDAYCADVTRTFTVGGEPSPEQKAVWDVVLEAQQKAVAKVGPGVRFQDVHDLAVDVLVDGLFDLGVLDGNRDEAIAKGAYKPYFMHRTSHWLGMDVHDVGPYGTEKDSTVLEPGMVLTIEPGLYFRLDGPNDRYRGIGVRIEDDVLVTENGRDNLTAEIPKRL